ncbi:MAG: cytochrome P450 [Ardenticatenaceae bacterium]|nr:cytochrome P450 [Ardenticatenaceae bacterium]
MTHQTERLAQEAEQPPHHPDTIPLLHNFLEFQANPLQFWLDVGREGPVVRVQLGPFRPFWVVTDADFLEYILHKKSRNFPRDHQLRQRNGLDNMQTVFNAPTWEEWLWRRRLLQPAFHAKELAKFGETMVGEAVALIDSVETSEPLELVSFMKAMTMRIICKAMFSASLGDTAVLQHAFEQVTEFSYKRLSSVFNLPLWVPTPDVVKTRRAVNARLEIIERIVQDRLSSGKAKGDLLDMLISAHLDEAHISADGRRFTGYDLVSEMISIVFAGHETTAMTLMWLFYKVAQDAEIERKLWAEVDGVLNGRLPTLADLDNMPYTHWLIQETLRYYPSVYVTLREAEEDDAFDGYHIPAGTQFVVNIRALHRDPRYWDEPERFWPERFGSDELVPSHKFAYMPFLAGPKKCIGDNFAMMEMRLVVPTIMQRLRFHYEADEPVQEKAGFVMETKQPVMMRVEKRAG